MTLTSRETPAHPAQGGFELLTDAAVDEEVGGAVEHDEEVSDGLETHDPERRDVLGPSLGTAHLQVCNKY